MARYSAVSNTAPSRLAIPMRTTPPPTATSKRPTAQGSNRSHYMAAIAVCNSGIVQRRHRLQNRRSGPTAAVPLAAHGHLYHCDPSVTVAVTMFSTRSRGQVGTGTLIVFISVVLVAGAAAGVVTNTAGFLQFESETTTETSTAEVNNRLVVAYSVGVVDSDSTETELEQLELIVGPAPDATPIDLDNTTVQYQSPDRATTLVSNEADDHGATFSIEPLQGETDNNVLSDSTDRSKLVIPLDNETTALESLRRGETVTVTLTPASGATTQVQHTVPPADPNDRAVRL